MPLLGQNYAFGHLPKCAGSTISRILRQYDGSQEIRGGHDGLIESDLDGRAGLVSIVDPWTWYARLWAHAMAAGEQARSRAFEYGPTFQAFVLSATEMSHFPYCSGVIYDDLKGSQGAGGLWTQAVTFLIGGQPVLCMDAHRPLEALMEVLKVLLPEMRENTREGRGDYPDIPEGDYPEWYSAAEINAVSMADGELASRMGLNLFAASDNLTWTME